MSEGAKVTRIAIGRLHNLGNYEHIRYDVTVDLSNGDDPGLIISRCEKLLAALAPVKRDYDYERAVKVMSDPELAKEERAGNIEIYKRRIEKHEKAAVRRKLALELFSELGGTSEHVDAKANWDDDDYWEDYDY